MADKKKPGDPKKKDVDIDSLMESAGLVGTPGSVGDETEAGGRVEGSRGDGRGPVHDESEAGQSIDSALTQSQVSSEEEELMALAEKLGMPFIRMKDYDPEPALITSFPPQVAHSYRVFPISRDDDGVILVAMAQPENIRTVDDLEQLLAEPVKGAIAKPDDVNKLIDEYFGQVDSSIESILEGISEESVDFAVREDDIGNLEKIVNQPPIIRLVNLILLQAVKDRASDLHLEPFQETFRIRYRVDGALHETKPPPLALQSAIISRIKVMSNMDISESRLPQDGRIRLNISNRDVDLRVSTLPTVGGESIVLRILDQQNAMVGL
ncbi:MAG: Flp pilus assembly complex ATPase component TadA, partial [Candidatus Omnitrophica bacterium]|nr:Flp pilus assembly complex ATPase component TadA [Candidatus Omnitrophota bacterium]